MSVDLFSEFEREGDCSPEEWVGSDAVLTGSRAGSEKACCAAIKSWLARPDRDFSISMLRVGEELQSGRGNSELVFTDGLSVGPRLRREDSVMKRVKGGR